MAGRTTSAANTLFAALEASGRFHRDSAIGRVFHPGTTSYREIRTTESLHLAVRPDNHVSVHIDRVAPLAVRIGERCRYSVCRALVHNLFALVEGIGRFVTRRRGAHSCHLDCEIVWVPDGEDAGAEAVQPVVT